MTDRPLNSALKLGMYPAHSVETLPAPASVMRIDVAADLNRTELQLPDEPILWSVVSVNRTSEASLREWIGCQRRDDDYRLLTYDVLPLQLNVRA